MDTNNLNSEIKRLFFQLLATGNKYVNHVYDGTINYHFKIDDVRYGYSINFFKSYNYVANENESSNKINKLEIPNRNPNTVYFTKDCCCDCDCKTIDINNDNIKASFTIDIDKLGTINYSSKGKGHGVGLYSILLKNSIKTFFKIKN